MADLRQKPAEPPATEAAAMEDRIRRYVDRRLGETAERLLERPGFYARYRVELWAFLILFTLAAQWLWLVQKSVPRPAAAAAALPAATPPAPPAAAPSAAPSGSAAAAMAAPAPPAPRPPWPDWLRAHPQVAQAGLDKLLAEEGVRKGSLSGRQRLKTAELRGDLALAKTGLDAAHLGKLLFEYVMKRAQGETATGQIDAAINDSEYPAAAQQRLAAELGVAAAGARTKKEEFQHELVMAWLEKNVPR